nr:MAG TPA: hypothetical protein [Caudoviricetes sp.]
MWDNVGHVSHTRKAFDTNGLRVIFERCGTVGHPYTPYKGLCVE